MPELPQPGVLGTEAGHAALAPRTDLELQIVRHLGKGVAHVPNEQILSGPGLLTLYRVLCEIRTAPIRFTSPVQVTAAALDGSDPIAAECIDTFCAWLGGLVGDLVALYGAYGGVSLAGGFLPQILPLLQRSGIRRALPRQGHVARVARAHARACDRARTAGCERCCALVSGQGEQVGGRMNARRRKEMGIGRGKRSQVVGNVDRYKCKQTPAESRGTASLPDHNLTRGATQ